MKFDAEALQGFTARVLNRAGLSEQEAATFAENLIEANLRGVNSHGITRLGVYAKRVEAGLIVSGAELKILKEGPATYAFDAGNGPGSVMGTRMMELCIAKAKKMGCCTATAMNGTHWGVASFYARLAARENLIALVSCNADAAVVPAGGARPMLGTNPLCVAIPAGTHEPLMLDMATSVAARGKVVQAMKEGRSIPADWSVDKDGNPTTDPAKALEGYMLPFGGYKGYGIGLIIDILCSCLGGSLNSRTCHSFWYDFEQPQNVGYFMCLIDVSAFLPPELFLSKVDEVLEDMKKTPTAPGVQEVLIPGEPEFRNTLKHRAEGITLADSLVEELKALGARYGVAFPEEKN